MSDWMKDNRFFVDLSHRLEQVRQAGMVLYPETSNDSTGAVMIFGRKGFALAIIDPALPDGIAFIKKFGSFAALHNWIYGENPNPPRQLGRGRVTQ